MSACLGIEVSLTYSAILLSSLSWVSISETSGSHCGSGCSVCSCMYIVHLWHVACIPSDMHIIQSGQASLHQQLPAHCYSVAIEFVWKVIMPSWSTYRDTQMASGIDELPSIPMLKTVNDIRMLMRRRNVEPLTGTKAILVWWLIDTPAIEPNIPAKLMESGSWSHWLMPTWS